MVKRVWSFEDLERGFWLVCWKSKSCGSGQGCCKRWDCCHFFSMEWEEREWEGFGAESWIAYPENFSLYHPALLMDWVWWYTLIFEILIILGISFPRSLLLNLNKFNYFTLILEWLNFNTKLWDSGDLFWLHSNCFSDDFSQKNHQINNYFFMIFVLLMLKK